MMLTMELLSAAVDVDERGGDALEETVWCAALLTHSPTHTVQSRDTLFQYAPVEILGIHRVL